MAISKEEVEHIAKLVRLRLTEKEIEKYRKQLGEILDYVSQLKKIPAENVQPFSSTGLKNVFRLDEPKQRNSEQTKRLIHQSPEQEKGLIKTKKIFNN